MMTYTLLLYVNVKGRLHDNSQFRNQDMKSQKTEINLWLLLHVVQ